MILHEELLLNIRIVRKLTVYLNVLLSIMSVLDLVVAPNPTLAIILIKATLCSTEWKMRGADSAFWIVKRFV